eukprot:976148-Pelagomonas_calceolata.AAC.3
MAGSGELRVIVLISHHSSLPLQHRYRYHTVRVVSPMAKKGNVIPFPGTELKFTSHLRMYVHPIHFVDCAALVEILGPIAARSFLIMEFLARHLSRWRSFSGIPLARHKE